MVEVEKSCLGRTEVGQAAGNSARAFRRLVRVCEVEIKAIEYSWRTQSALDATDAYMTDSPTKKKSTRTFSPLWDEVPSADVNVFYDAFSTFFRRAEDSPAAACLVSKASLRFLTSASTVT